MRRRKLAAAMVFAALSAWLGGATDTCLVWAHTALARNVGGHARAWGDVGKGRVRVHADGLRALSKRAIGQ